MPNKGLRQYGTIEAQNNSLNAEGMDLMLRAFLTVGNYTVYTPPAGYIYTGIISINGVGKVQAKSVDINGDDLNLTGNYRESPSNSNELILMISADVIYGRFSEITIWKDEVASADAQFRAILSKK